MRRLVFTLTLLLGPAAASLAGCTDEETPFNELDRLRVLGISATRPWVREGEVTGLAFLAVNGDPDLQGAPIANAWYFCPVQADSTVGFECFVQSADQLRAVTGTTAEIPPELDDVPFTELGIFIGNAPTQTLPAILSSELIADLCDMLDMVDLPPFVTRPACNGRFPVTVYLEYGVDTSTTPDQVVIDPTERVVAFRTIDIVYDPGSGPNQEPNPPNQNPEISGLGVSVEGAGMFVETTTRTPVVLKYDTTYDLRLDVADDQSEVFIPSDDDIEPREVLTVTWFIEGGSTDSERTGFLPADDANFEDLVNNSWTTPKRDEVRQPADPNENAKASLYMVIRDGRGGLSWIVRDFEFNDATGL